MAENHFHFSICSRQLRFVQSADKSFIIGMGETWDDRAKMLEVLVNLKPQPESVPLNALVPVKGTPLENQPLINPLEMVRMVATLTMQDVVRMRFLFSHQILIQ